METLTIEAAEGQLKALADQLIEKLRTQHAPILFLIPGVEITLQPGEHYAGPVLNADGKVLHHLVLMAPKPEKKLDWQSAMDWAASVGGYLPGRQEQALLFANCKPHLEPVWHWSCETHESDASCAWGCGFGTGARTAAARATKVAPLSSAESPLDPLIL